MVKSIYIPDLFQQVIDNMNDGDALESPVFFDAGHYKDVTRNLTLKDSSINDGAKKYPLIWLVMDFVERKGSGKDYYCELNDIGIIIGVPTLPEYAMTDRRDKSFLPTLYPVYDEFMYQLTASGLFTATAPDDIPHDKIDRPYWGGVNLDGSGGSANLWNDMIDAIQIRKMQLFVNYQNCL
jgi:hypothetical protein